MSVLRIRTYLLLGAAGMVLLVASPLLAQVGDSVTVLIDWHASSFAPPSFPGKVLPTRGTPVSVSVAVIDGGRVADLSRTTVHWLLNDDVIASGVGLQRTTFSIPNPAGDVARLAVRIPQYRRSDGTVGALNKLVDIPVVHPEVVIEALYPFKTFTPPAVRVRAVPYFFSTTSDRLLNYAWHVNGERVANAENPQLLTVTVGDVPPNTRINIRLAVNHPTSLREVAKKIVYLTTR